MKPIKFRNVWLWVILALGFTLRLWGIGFGLPDLFHADEPIVVNHAMAYGTGDFNPHFFKIPPLTSYFLFFCYGIYFLAGQLLGWIANADEFGKFFLTNPSSFYLLGRVLLGALTGTVTIYLIFRLLEKNFSRTHGYLAAFFLATAFLHVRDSHYIYADIPLLLVLVACFFPIFRILEREKWIDYLTFGILAGVAVATKYNGVFIFVPFLMTHFWRKASFFHLLVASVVSFLTFAACNPFSLLDWRFFLNELITQGGSQGYAGFGHHLFYSLLGGLGFPLWFAALAGLMLALFRRDRKRLLFAVFFVIYYCPVLVLASQPYDRYVLPLLPLAVFFAADSFLELLNRFRPTRVVLVLVALLCASPSLAKAILVDHLLSQTDIRTLARGWVEANIPPGSKLALDTPFFMPRLKAAVAQLEEKKKGSFTKKVIQPL